MGSCIHNHRYHSCGIIPLASLVRIQISCFPLSQLSSSGSGQAGPFNGGNRIRLTFRSSLFFLDLTSTNVDYFSRFQKHFFCDFLSLSLDSCLVPFLARFLILRFRCAGNLPPSPSGTDRSLPGAFPSFRAVRRGI